MTSKAWKTKLTFTAPVALAALLNPALAQAGAAGGWDCTSADQQTYFNFLEPKLSPGRSSHVLSVGGYDGYYIDKAHLMDFRSYGDVSDTQFKVKILGPMTPSAGREEALLGYLQGTKDEQGQWHVSFTSERGGDEVEIPLTCKF